jgi:hypothetical protein
MLVNNIKMMDIPQKSLDYVVENIHDEPGLNVANRCQVQQLFKSGQI